MIAGCALLGEFAYFYIVGPDQWDDTLFFQQVMNEAGADGGRMAFADDVRLPSRARGHEPRLVVHPTGCTLSCRF
jgi:hypothetical protein